MTWVRNHSNYMAERGFLDYMRIVAVLVRGILINFLTLLPYFLLAALLLGLIYTPVLQEWSTSGTVGKVSGAGWVKWLQDQLGTRPPLLLTPWVGVIVLVWYLLFPMVIRLFKVIAQKQSLQTGNESSVKLRDKYERSFGAALLIVIGVALIELLPLLIHYFHSANDSIPKIREIIATLAGGSSVLAMSGAGALLSRLGKVLRPLATIGIGLLGLLLPLLVILYATEYLVYGDPGGEINYMPLSVMPIILALGIVLALFLGTLKGAFEKRGWLLGLLALVVAVACLLYIFEGVFPDRRWFFVLAMAVEIWLFCWLAVDINLTSVHGLYRDRLAAAFLVGDDTEGDVDIEEDIDLHEICQYENGSTAPYHLVNVALNLQGSQDIGIRERNSDFFIFSKKFIGGDRTGYCRSETMEAVFPQLDLATAMAISAAAASPNMGAFTNAPMVAVMTLFNIRLGYWVPNPGHLATFWAGRILDLPADRQKAALEELALRFETDAAAVRTELEILAGKKKDAHKSTGKSQPPGFTFAEVFEEELRQVPNRWAQVYGSGYQGRKLGASTSPTPEHGLVGIGFSGGGIRSATINLGITQALHARGVFDHADYMSTVSGGGYLGSSISTLMRRKSFASEIDGHVRLAGTREGGHLVEIIGKASETREYWIPEKYQLAVEDGQAVSCGDPLIQAQVNGTSRGSLRERFSWRVRPRAFLREISSQLDETYRWVNLSDGGHIENLATIELLRRRCRYIITGDGEADPKHHFGGLATLIRYARIDLGIHIDINPEQIRLVDAAKDPCSKAHIAIGRIRYPEEAAHGYLLYLKSSFTGDEDEVVVEYRNRNPTFPHESTADQFFDEGQFEAYRALGQHIGEGALAYAPAIGKLTYAGLASWFATMANELPHRWKQS